MAQPVTKVLIDIAAALKIVKHGQDCVPNPVTGYLLGAAIDNTLEISYTYPSLEGETDRDELMHMLGDTNVDNLCVGWYQSNHMVELYSSQVVDLQYNYQIDPMTPNSVLITYDPFQSKLGNFVMKAFRLSEKYIQRKKRDMNEYISPSEIYEELPLEINSVGLSSIYLRSIADSNKLALGHNFDSLSMAGNDARIEQQLSLLCDSIEDATAEQSKFVYHSKAQLKSRVDYIKYISECTKNKQPVNFTEGLLRGALKPMPNPNASRVEQALSLGHLERSTDELSNMVNTNMNNLVVNKEVQNNA